MALSTASLWPWNFVIGVSVPPMIESVEFGTYIFFVMMFYLTSFWAYFLVPEAKEKSLEELADVFSDTSAADEKEIMRKAAMRAVRESANITGKFSRLSVIQEF